MRLRSAALAVALWASLFGCRRKQPAGSPPDPGTAAHDPQLATHDAAPAASRDAAASALAPATHTQVLVVGAGMSGLAAARDLRAAGLQVIVLEARDRVGGRTWTDRSRPEHPLDLGASWIHDFDGNPLTALAKQVAAKLAVTDYDDQAVFAADGKALSDPQQAGVDRRFQQLLVALAGLIKERRAARQPDLSLADGVAAVLARPPLSKLDPGEQRQLDWSVHTIFEHEEASDAADLSLFALPGIAEDTRVGARDDAIVASGYDTLVKRVAAGLEIRLGHVVQRIEHGAGGVVVTTDHGVFSAERVVVTLPVGVLKAGTVVFAPPLPEAKLQALDHLGMSVLDKVYLRFAKPFWVDHFSLGYISEPRGQWGETFNLAHIASEPTLLCFNAGSFGLALEKMTDAEVTAAAMAPLRLMYGERAVAPEAVLITRWGQDPFARGSYSHVRPGGSEADCRTLAEPIGDRVFFAGEATDADNPSTVHGAYNSGVREARRIAALSPEPRR